MEEWNCKEGIQILMGNFWKECVEEMQGRHDSGY